MKKTIIILMTILATIVISCSTSTKSTVVPVKPSPVGFWKGQWSNTSPSTPPNLNFLWILFRTDGTIRETYDADTITGTNKESGTWAFVNDSTISWTVPNWGEYDIAKIRNTSTTIVGTWGHTTSADDKGQIYVTKQ